MTVSCALPTPAAQTAMMRYVRLEWFQRALSYASVRTVRRSCRASAALALAVRWNDEMRSECRRVERSRLEIV